MKRIPGQVYRGKLLVSYFAPSGVSPPIQTADHAQAFGRRRARNQPDNGFIVTKRLTAPVRRYERKEAMFNLVPLAGTRREVADADRQSCAIPSLGVPSSTAAVGTRCCR